MTNEIKEKQLKEVLYGLDYIGNKIKNDDGILELGVNNCKLLLDYITNLQEEVKEWEYIQDIQNNRKYRKRYLEERRKEETNLYLPDYDEVYQKYYEQKERIDKAIEKLKTLMPICIMPNNMLIHGTEKAKTIEETLNILRGENNE